MCSSRLQEAIQKVIIMPLVLESDPLHFVYPSRYSWVLLDIHIAPALGRTPVASIPCHVV